MKLAAGSKCALGLSVLLLGLSAWPSLGAAPAPAKAPLPTVLLYPASSGDIAALVDLRTRLRLDGHVEVLTYDPSSAAIQRASAEDGHPEWLVNAPVTDEGRMFLARALGASFYAVVSPGRAADSTHVELVETAPAARTFGWTGTNRQFGVRAMESQVADSVSHPVTYATAGDLTASAAPAPVAAPYVAPTAAPYVAPMPPVAAAPIPTPPVVAAAPVLALPITAPGPSATAVPAPPVVTAAVPAPAAAPILAPAPTLAPAPILAPAPDPVVPVAVPAPVVTASVPAPVAAASMPPVAGPIKIVLPNAVPPVVSAPVPTAVAAPAPVPLPLLKAAPVPLILPAQVAQAVPVPFIPPPLSPPAATLPPKTAPPSKAVIASPLNTATALPQLIPLPLPKAAPAAPLPQVIAAVPAPQMAPLSLLAVPRVAVPPTAVVTPKIAPHPVLPVQKPVQIAALPKRELPVPAPFVPEAARLDTVKPAPMPAVKKASANAEDTSAIAPLLAKGDAALDGGDAVSAIAFYRQAINGAPLSVVPRLKLAQAYQKDGLNDRALDEARRALEVAPDSLPVQQFLSDLDQQTGTTAGTLVRVRAAVERSPTSPAAHAALADALWNNGDLGGAEAEYKAASALAPAGSHLGSPQLAQLYAAEARYGDCLAILHAGGKGNYAVAIQIVKNRADTLSSTLASSRGTFAAGKSTREQFYDDARKLSTQAQALAGFVAEVTPPIQYKLSHLHRMLSTNLLAQESAALVSFIETGDSRQNDTLSLLERSAATEMLTAQATEEKLGLWKEKPAQ